MRVNKDKWKVKESDFGPLLKYIKDENVTDINYNGTSVWVDDLTKGRYCTDVMLTKDFIERFTTRIADAVSESFNQYHPLLEAETETLRISIVNEEYANTGRSISIRKTPVIRRLTKEKMISENYCSDEFLCFVEQCVHAKMNMLMCGLPGTGKTEFLKYLTSHIPPEERVITIEDNLEIHYSQINPGKDCVELKVDSKNFSYTTAIKACLRQNPQWILLSEARSSEVKYLLESMSTGTHCLTTIHTDDVRKVPDRIKNMVQDPVTASRVENDVFAFLDAAILVKKKFRNGKIRRYIDQMCFFSREENGRNEIVMVIEDGMIVNRNLPAQIINKFVEADIFNVLGQDILSRHDSENKMSRGYDTSFNPESAKETVTYLEHLSAEESAISSNDIKEENILEEVEEKVEDVELPQENAVNTNEKQDENADNSAEEITNSISDETNIQKAEEIAENKEKEHLDVASKTQYDFNFAYDNVLDFSYVRHKQDDSARLRRAQKK